MAEYFIGKREQISWGEESSYGTEATPTEIIGKNVRVEPDFSVNWQDILSAGADSRELNSREVGPKSYNFTLRFYAVSWKFLKYLTHGSVSTVDNGDGTYTHTLSLSNVMNSFTLEWAKRGSTNHVMTLSGAVMKNATISFNASAEGGEGFVEVEAECVAQDLSTGTSITSLSTPTKDAIQFRMAKLTVEGNEITEVKSGSFTFNNGIDEADSRYANATLDQTMGQPIPKTARYNFNFSISQKDSTFFDYFNNQTALTGTNKVEFVRGTDDYLTIDMSEIYVESATSPTNVEEISVTDFVGVPKSISLTAKDDISSY